jgi:hypothetical protein
MIVAAEPVGHKVSFVPNLCFFFHRGQVPRLPLDRCGGAGFADASATANRLVCSAKPHANVTAKVSERGPAGENRRFTPASYLGSGSSLYPTPKRVWMNEWLDATRSIF